MDKNFEGTTPDLMESLRQTIRRQAAAMQARGRLLDNMAYQIRTLSNAVVGFSDLLLSENLSDDQRDYATEINQAGKGLSELVNEALDWARLGSGRLQIVRSEQVLDDLLNELEQSARPAARDKRLAFELHRDPALPETLVTDGERLLKCLINLTANAIHYTDSGFVRISATSEQRDAKTYVRLAVADSGPGIASDKLRTIFEPALNEEDANAQIVTQLGKGLSAAAGLPLTGQLVELLGGTLEAHSEPGKGSTFSLRLPIEAATAKTAKTEKTSDAPPAVSESSQAQTPLPILLVEDQESNRTVVRLMLQTMGHTVETAVDGQEAVDMATPGKYSLIIMDLKMPRMDGYEATRCLRAKHVKAPIVALTAMSLNPDEKKVIDGLFDAFLSKPIDSEQLLKAVGRFVSKASSTAQSP